MENRILSIVSVLLYLLAFALLVYGMLVMFGVVRWP